MSDVHDGREGRGKGGDGREGSAAAPLASSSNTNSEYHPALHHQQKPNTLADRQTDRQPTQMPYIPSISLPRTSVFRRTSFSKLPSSLDTLSAICFTWSSLASLSGMRGREGGEREGWEGRDRGVVQEAHLLCHFP